MTIFAIRVTKRERDLLAIPLHSRAVHETILDGS